MPGQHLFSMFTGGVGNFFAAGHARNFFDAFGEVERLDIGRGVVGLDGLGNPVMLIAMAGNLWQVRDTKNLMRMRDMAQLFANDGGGFPTNAGVHLIENQGRYLVRTR